MEGKCGCDKNKAEGGCGCGKKAKQEGEVKRDDAKPGKHEGGCGCAKRGIYSSCVCLNLVAAAICGV